MPATLPQQIDSTVAVFEALKGQQATIERASRMICDTLESGRKLLICGNGGSAAEAGHFATELVGRYCRNRQSLPAINLSADGSLLSCIGNDYGFDKIFSRQVEGLGQPGDLFVGITSSGNSANVMEALATAKKMRLQTLVLLGKGGGKAKGLADYEIIPAGDSGRSAQEAHLFLIHYFCEIIDAEFCK
jgi:D-sedoheptulose 7-phosphate isomerase